MFKLIYILIKNITILRLILQFINTYIFIHYRKMKSQEQNPWAVKNIDEFLYYCCPECNTKNQSQEFFLKHALDQHPNSKEYIINLDFKHEENNSDRLFKASENVKSEIKIEESEIFEETDDIWDDHELSNVDDPDYDYIQGISNNDDSDYEVKNENNANSDRQQKSNLVRKKKNIRKNKDIEENKEETMNIDDPNLGDRIGKIIFKCDFCEKSLSTASTLRLHIKKFHENNVKDVTCEKCGKMCTTKINLKKHFKSKHEANELKSLKCEFCENRYDRMGQLINHVKKFHEGKPLPVKVKEEKIFNCEKCGKIYKSVQTLKEHVESTHEGIKFSCELCPKQFSHRSGLKTHVEGVHEKKKFSCEICFKEYKYKTRLFEHRRQEHSENKIIHQCKLCDFSTIHKNNLTQHVQIIHEGFRVTCDVCGKSFAQQSYLKKHHEAEHQGMSHFLCKYCGKTFPSPSAHKTHVKCVHE